MPAISTWRSRTNARCLRDTGGGLVQALPLIDGDPFYCVNADNWFVGKGKNALVRMAEAWVPEAMDVLMLVVPFEHAGNTQGQGDFDLDAEGRLSREGAKRARPYVWTGIQLLARHVVADPPSEVFSTNLFWDRAIARGRCYGLVHDGRLVRCRLSRSDRLDRSRPGQSQPEWLSGPAPGSMRSPRTAGSPMRSPPD